MRAFRVVAAFLAGVWLYYAAVVVAGGVLAAVGAPSSYFAFFGRGHNEIALALLFFFGWATPVGLLVTGGTLAIGRLLCGNKQPVWGPALLGMLLCFGYWQLASVSFFAPNQQPQVGVVHALLAHVSMPWWAAANVGAPWVGFALAVSLVFRAQRER